MSVNLETKAARAKLSPRREPYWHRVKTGCFLGYRVLESGEGTWIARWRDDDGRQRYQALGVHETFDQARKAAEAWFEHARHTDGGDVLTVEQVCSHYVKELRAKLKDEAAVDAEYRFAKRINGTEFGKLTMDKLRPKHIKEWRDAIAAVKSPATVNRNLVVLLAAFNLAFVEKLVSEDSAWRGVNKVKVPDSRRERVLKSGEGERLLNACDADLRPFVEGLMLTGCRPGELANVTVSCFDPVHGTLKFPKGKTGGRSVPISDRMVALCAELSKSKLPKALLFTRADGKQWHRDNWKKPLKEAVLRAKLGNDVVLYTLRHTAISQMIAGGMNAFTVATLTGTSVAMIQQHYGHLFADQVKAALNALG
jgi:integrase